MKILREAGYWCSPATRNINSQGADPPPRALQLWVLDLGLIIVGVRTQIKTQIQARYNIIGII